MDFTILMRHGATEYNEEPERFRGLLDLPLIDSTREDIEENAEDLCGLPISSIHIDSLKRDEETAKIVQSVLGKAGPEPLIVRDSGLLPWDVGELAGLKVSEALDRYLNYMRHPKETPPGGEPYSEFEERTLTNIQKILNKGILAITHTGNIQLVKAWMKSGYKIPVPVEAVIKEGPEDGEQPGDFVIIVRGKDGKPTFGSLGQAIKHEHEEVFGKV